MSGVNKAILIGFLGKDAETRYTAAGNSVTTFSLACSETWKEHGEPKEHTEWFQCVLWGGLGEKIAQYLTKGTKVYVEGRHRTRKWEAKDGHKGSSLEIHIDQIQLLSNKKDES